MPMVYMVNKAYMGLVVNMVKQYNLINQMNIFIFLFPLTQYCLHEAELSLAQLSPSLFF